MAHIRLAIQLALKGPRETSVLVDSSSIASHFLLHKHTRSKVPSPLVISPFGAHAESRNHLSMGVFVRNTFIQTLRHKKTIFVRS